MDYPVVCPLRWYLLKQTAELANEHCAIAEQMVHCAGSGTVEAFTDLALRSRDTSSMVRKAWEKYYRHCKEHGCGKPAVAAFPGRPMTAEPRHSEGPSTRRNNAP